MIEDSKQLYLNDLNLSLKEVWRLLEEGARDRHSPLHTPSVATVTSDNLPSQRIMVLRYADRDTRLLRFNTDARVSKVSDIGKGGAISILGYHPEAKIQLRLSAYARVEVEGRAADDAWADASPYGKRCYMADPAPGSMVDAPASGLNPDIEGQKPTDAQVAPARANFAVLLAEIRCVEWLYLAHTGHRRAVFDWDSLSNHWDSRWLVP